jgi:monoamine oxidase
MFYDVIVIGGGISGLYQAWQRLKREPELSLLLLEANSNVGGRIRTFHNRYYPSVEFGAGRFHDKHVLLLELIRELGLESKIVPIHGTKNYISSLEDGDGSGSGTGVQQYIHEDVLNNLMKSVLKRFDNNISRTFKNKLQNMTFLEYLKEVLSLENVQLIYNSFGYSSELTDMNAYDSIFLIRQYYASNFYVLNVVLDRLLKPILNFFHCIYHHLQI